MLDPTIRLAERARRGARPAQAAAGCGCSACASLLAPATIAVQSLTGGDAHPLLIAFTSAALFGLVVLRMAGLVRRVEEQANELARVARTDALTGAPNRRAWDEQLAVELARAARDGEPVSVALLDLDHFKAYNDLRGHQAGDRLLREAAAAWQGRLRTMDVIARYGGEEFGLILPGCPPDLAAGIVDRLRGLTPEGETTSAGVACWDGTETRRRARRPDRPRALRGQARRARPHRAREPGRRRRPRRLAPRRQVVHEPRDLVRLAHRRQDERRDAALGERLQPLALRRRVAEEEDLAHEVVGHELDRAPAVAVLPRLQHRVDPLAPSEPAEERGVDGDGRVGDEHPPGRRERLVRGAAGSRRSGTRAPSRARRTPPRPGACRSAAGSS